MYRSDHILWELERVENTNLTHFRLKLGKSFEDLRREFRISVKLSIDTCKGIRGELSRIFRTIGPDKNFRTVLYEDAQ